MTQIYNFSAGPAMLPKPVLLKAKQELLNWKQIGVSVMEISHRSEHFFQCIEEAEQNLRSLLNIPKTYKILFCQGGARGQFSAVPMNLLGNLNFADYVSSGYWSSCAFNEAKKYCIPKKINVKIKKDGKQFILPMKDWYLNKSAAYVHYCPNETIHGIEIFEEPKHGSFENKIFVGDFSSTILSRPININKYGIIYAGAQKNIGPSGITLVIIKENLLGRAKKITPSIINYKILSEQNSMFNTPPMFSWYLSGLVFKWLKDIGGIKTIERLNKEKAKLLYDKIDESDFYINTVHKRNRSMINIPFQLNFSRLNELFLKESKMFGLIALNNHYILGGMRASIYNAMPIKGVQKLVDFMIYFEKKYG